MSAEATAALPTVPVYYEAANFPLSEGWPPYRLDHRGQWYGNSGHVTVERMREIMPLTRLVPVTDLAEQIDVSSFAELLSEFMSRDAGLAQHQGAALHILREIREGRMNK